MHWHPIYQAETVTIAERIAGYLRTMPDQADRFSVNDRAEITYRYERSRLPLYIQGNLSAVILGIRLAMR